MAGGEPIGVVAALKYDATKPVAIDEVVDIHLNWLPNGELSVTLASVSLYAVCGHTGKLLLRRPDLMSSTRQVVLFVEGSHSI